MMRPEVCWIEIVSLFSDYTVSSTGGYGLVKKWINLIIEIKLEVESDINKISKTFG